MMRRGWIGGLTLVLVALCGGGRCRADGDGGADLRTADFLPHDALVAGCMSVDSLGRPYDAILGFVGRFAPAEDLAPMLAPLREWEARVGISVRDDLLALLGGEVAFSIAIDDIDRVGMTLLSMSGEEKPDPGSVLDGLLFAVGVFDPGRFDGSLGRILESVGGRLELLPGGLRTLHGPPGSGFEGILHYRYHRGFAVVGFSPAALDSAAARFDAGGGLRSAPGFRAVFANLDPDPEAFTYLSLHGVQELLRRSNLVRAGLARVPDAGRLYRAFVEEMDWGTGIGWATYTVPGGTVSQSFAPFDMGSFAAAYAGIVAAVAIPNLSHAIDRGKQKRTMADLRSVGVAIESYAVDHDHYPVSSMEPLPLAEAGLVEMLSPTYIRELPRTDGWGHPLFYSSDAEGTTYTLRSLGKDGMPTPGSRGAMVEPAADIIFADGGFVSWPEGPQN